MLGRCGISKLFCIENSKYACKFRGWFIKGNKHGTIKNKIFRFFLRKIIFYFKGALDILCLLLIDLKEILISLR